MATPVPFCNAPGAAHAAQVAYGAVQIVVIGGKQYLRRVLRRRTVYRRHVLRIVFAGIGERTLQRRFAVFIPRFGRIAVRQQFLFQPRGGGALSVAERGAVGAVVALAAVADKLGQHRLHALRGK